MKKTRKPKSPPGCSWTKANNTRPLRKARGTRRAKRRRNGCPNTTLRSPVDAPKPSHRTPYHPNHATFQTPTKTPSPQPPKQPHRRRTHPLATPPHGTTRRQPIPTPKSHRQHDRRLHLQRPQTNHRTRRRPTRPTKNRRQPPHPTPKQTRLPSPPILEQRNHQQHRRRPPNHPTSPKRNQPRMTRTPAPFAQRKGARASAALRAGDARGGGAPHPKQTQPKSQTIKRPRRQA